MNLPRAFALATQKFGTGDDRWSFYQIMVCIIVLDLAVQASGPIRSIEHY